MAIPKTCPACESKMDAVEYLSALENDHDVSDDTFDAIFAEVGAHHPRIAEDYR